jgi:hypothetical protein
LSERLTARGLQTEEMLLGAAIKKTPQGEPQNQKKHLKKSPEDLQFLKDPIEGLSRCKTNSMVSDLQLLRPH